MFAPSASPKLHFKLYKLYDVVIKMSRMAWTEAPAWDLVFGLSFSATAARTRQGA